MLRELKEISMDRETKQWIVDRVIWILGLTFSVAVAATAFAGEATRLPTSSHTSIAARASDAGAPNGAHIKAG
jgi:hypothetical protein